MPVTEMPEVRRQLCNTISEVRDVEECNFKSSFLKNYYSNTITRTHLDNFEFASSPTVTYFLKKEETKDKINIMQQLAIVALAKNLFENAKPLEGEFLDSLNRFQRKNFSKTPTRL